MKIGPDGGGFNAIWGSAAVTAGQTYTFSIWVKRVAGSGTQNLMIIWNAGANTQLAISPVNGVWQRFTVTGVAPVGATSATGGLIYNGALGQTWYIDGVQFEQKPFATPYVHTDGATATRAAASVQAPAGVLNATQGWVAMRVRKGPSEYLSNSQPVRLWGHGTFGTNWLSVFHENGAYKFGSYTSSRNESGINNSWAINNLDTVIAAWTSTTLSISVNGGAFVSVARTDTLPVFGSWFNIGGDGAIQFNGDVLWFAVGTGTLTDADAATLSGYSDLPNLGLIPSNATMRWTADNATAYTR